MSLLGTHHKKTYWKKGSSRGPLYRLCSFLYILDMKGFIREIDEERMHRKAVFYICTKQFK
jgi:hypothetical protein